MNAEIENALRTALKIESDGARYYDMAAKESKHEGIKKIFKKLASDEREHYQTILDYYKHYEDNDDWPEKKYERTSNHEIHDFDHLFTADFFEGLKTSSSELSAVSTALLLEEESIRFYKEKADEEENIYAREFYEELVKIEREHHKVLAKVEQGLIEKVWKHNKYSPL